MKCNFTGSLVLIKTVISPQHILISFRALKSHFLRYSDRSWHMMITNFFQMFNTSLLTTRIEKSPIFTKISLVVLEIWPFFYLNNSLTKSKMCKNRIFELNLLLKVKSCQTCIIGLTKLTYTETRFDGSRQFLLLLQLIMVLRTLLIYSQPSDGPYWIHHLSLQHGCLLS